MTFPDHATYLEFWKQHPAFAGGQGGDVAEGLAGYASYDLASTVPARSSAGLPSFPP